MFQDALVESSGALKSKSSRYVWVTATFNTAIVAVMILVPLLYPEALPRTAMTAMLSAPPPPPAPPAPPPPASVARATKPTAQLDPYTAPRSIPNTIDMSREDPPPPVSNTGVAGMANAVPGGLGPLNTLALNTPPPVVRVAPARSTGPANVSSGVMAGQIIRKTAPVYPPLAKAARLSGSVVLHATISKTGTIQSLAVISGPEMLRANAVAAVQDWQYRPYLLNGDPTEVETTITVNFSFAN